MQHFFVIINELRCHCRDYVSAVLMRLGETRKNNHNLSSLRQSLTSRKRFLKHGEVFFELGWKTSTFRRKFISIQLTVFSVLCFVYFNKNEERRWFSNLNNYPNPREQQQFSKQRSRLIFSIQTMKCFSPVLQIKRWNLPDVTHSIYFSVIAALIIPIYRL